MSQRPSGYQRVKNDKYETPLWVVECLFPHIPKRIIKAFDPCCGSGNIVRALTHPFRACQIDTWGKDLERDGYDFLQDKTNHDAIVTNPPFKLAEEFIVHAISHSGFVAMLLRCDYDHAKTRKYLFGDCIYFTKKIALTKRIVWFERKGAAPSFNHAWYLWDYCYNGPPQLAYAP